MINRNHDYENFLATLLIKGRSERRAAFAVRAFNVEIAKVAGSVSDDKLGQMRLKFWSDSLNKIYDKDKSKPLPEHPVIYEVADVSLYIQKQSFAIMIIMSLFLK